MYKQTCEATQVRGEQSAEVLDLRMSCLQERLDGLRALTDVFGDATGEVVENAVSATNALSTLDRCADVPTLRAVIRPPDDPHTTAKVAEMRKRLARPQGAVRCGAMEGDAAGCASTGVEARAVGYSAAARRTIGPVGVMNSKSQRCTSRPRKY